MQYRTIPPAENGFDNEDDEFEGMRDFIQIMMRKSSSGDLLDSILVVVNICEQRALLNAHHPRVREWYSKTALFLRNALDILAHDKDDVCPQEKFENPALYFPDVAHLH